MNKGGECPLVIAGVKPGTKDATKICIKCDDDLHSCPLDKDVITEVWVFCPKCKIYDTIWLINGKTEVNRYWASVNGEIVHKKCEANKPATVFYTT